MTETTTAVEYAIYDENGAPLGWLQEEKAARVLGALTSADLVLDGPVDDVPGLWIGEFPTTLWDQAIQDRGLVLSRPGVGLVVVEV